MTWKFWKKDKETGDAVVVKEIKLGRPKELPDRVGMYMVTQLKEDPDWVWSLRAAMRPRADEKNAFEIRIFNPADAVRKGVMIANYNTLDAHPEMILFAGWYNKSTGLVKIEKTLKKVA